MSFKSHSWHAAAWIAPELILTYSSSYAAAFRPGTLHIYPIRPYTLLELRCTIYTIFLRVFSFFGHSWNFFSPSHLQIIFALVSISKVHGWRVSRGANVISCKFMTSLHSNLHFPNLSAQTRSCVFLHALQCLVKVAAGKSEQLKWRQSIKLNLIWDREKLKHCCLCLSNFC